MPTQFAHALQVSNGRIAYNEYDATSGISSIHTMNGDGTNGKTVVDATSLDYDDLFPTWSPNGVSLVYTHFSYVSADPNYGESLWLARTTDGAATKIAQNVNDGGKWSPDSVYIYYELNATQVFRVHADGTGSTEKVLDPGTTIGMFDISPDGTKLLYTTADSVYVETIATQTSSKIVGPSSDAISAAYWSPSGTKIMYKTVASNTDVTLYVANSDGSGAHAVTATSPYVSLASDTTAMWSPDSSQLLYVFSSSSTGACQTAGQVAYNIYVADTASGVDTALTSGTGVQDTHASWSPDGQRILYAGTPCGTKTNTHIYTMAADGSNSTDLTPTEAGDALYPSWETIITPSQVTQGTTTTMTVTPAENLAGRSVTVPTNAVLDNNGIVGDITIQTGGTLMGSGTTGDVVVATGGVIAPGNSPGCLHTNDLTMAAGATYQFQVGGTTVCTTYDQIIVTGTTSIAGAVLSVSTTNGFTGQPGNTYVIVSNDGNDPVVGTFAGLAEGSTFSANGMTFKISYVGGDGNDIVLSQVAAAASATPAAQSTPSTLVNTGSSATSVGLVGTVLIGTAFTVYCVRKNATYVLHGSRR